MVHTKRHRSDMYKYVRFDKAPTGFNLIKSWNRNKVCRRGIKQDLILRTKTWFRRTLVNMDNCVHQETDKLISALKKDEDRSVLIMMRKADVNGIYHHFSEGGHCAVERCPLAFFCRRAVCEYTVENNRTDLWNGLLWGNVHCMEWLCEELELIFGKRIEETKAQLIADVLFPKCMYKRLKDKETEDVLAKMDITDQKIIF